MIRIVILALLAVLVVMLIFRLAPGLRVRAMAIGRSPILRYLLTNVILRLIRLLIFRR